jgi:RNA polymerase sigma-70 factor, ECF subfamily
MNDADKDFQKIYSAYHPKILRYLSRLVGADEAEDLVQEVFIKASLALPRFRGESSLSTWLYRIATNTATDQFRRTTRPNPRPNSSEDGNEDAFEKSICSQEKPFPVEQQVVSNEMGACIQRYVDQLPESYRTVLVLSDMEGLSGREIAQVLGVSLETVKIRLHRARKRLRDQFLDHCEYYWVSELSWRAS